MDKPIIGIWHWLMLGIMMLAICKLSIARASDGWTTLCLTPEELGGEQPTQPELYGGLLRASDQGFGVWFYNAPDRFLKQGHLFYGGRVSELTSPLLPHIPPL